MSQDGFTEKIRQLGSEAGLDTLGFAAATPFNGYLLHDSPRRDPRLSLPEARSIIVAAVYIGGLALPAWEDPSFGRTSRLYLSGFFLDVVKPLKPIVAFLKAEGYRALVCDGGRPGGSILPLKLAAVRAGLGWQGKHSLLISQKYGTFLALGGILTDAEFVRGPQPEPNRCKDCNVCQIACPLGALERPHLLDRARCLSHQLQEENLSPAARKIMGNRVADCEICQTACPWNRKHLKTPLQTKLTVAFQREIDTWERRFHLPELVALREEDYREEFGHLHTGIPFEFFQRNAHLALAHAATSPRRIPPKTSGTL